jgi:hypothetical protein
MEIFIIGYISLKSFCNLIYSQDTKHENDDVILSLVIL